MIERYRQFLSETDFACLLEEIQRPLPPAIRLNTLKSDIHERRKSWEAWYGWQMDQVPFCPDGYQISWQSVPPSQTLEYKMGDYYIQDAASMLPVEMFNPDSAPLILDMAAAPGGKTTHLVSKFHDQALIVANDSSASRLTPLRASLQAWGAMGVMVTNFGGEQFGAWLPETFDKILLDAPCSGDTLRPHKGSKERDVSEKEQERLQQRQISLLESAFMALKVGGEIVYSTCTMSPEEDEAVLNALLQQYPATIEAITHIPFNQDVSGLVINDYNPQVKNAIRLWPHLYCTSGFFAGKIRKTDHVPVKTMPVPQKPIQHETYPASKVMNTLLQNYGFNFEADHLTFWQQGDSIYAAPELLIEQFGELPHLSMGFLIGQIMDKEFVPSHELITRFGQGFKQNRLTLSDVQSKQWLEGRDLRENGNLSGIVLVQDERGRFIGRGKASSGRLRNLLPKRLI